MAITFFFHRYQLDFLQKFSSYKSQIFQKEIISFKTQLFSREIFKRQIGKNNIFFIISLFMMQFEQLIAQNFRIYKYYKPISIELDSCRKWQIYR